MVPLEPQILAAAAAAVLMGLEAVLTVELA
jgi:hypothetical protein